MFSTETRARREVKLNPFIVGVVGFVLVIVGFFIFLLFQSLEQDTQYNEIRIKDFSSYFPGVSREREKSVYISLYDIVAMNLDGDATEEELSGEAIVREGSVSLGEEGGAKEWNFIVDLPFVGQSYAGFFVSGENPNVYNGGYAVLFTCLDKSELIYGDFGCRDMFSGEGYLVPICNVLPIAVDEFDFAARQSSVYTISCYFTSDETANVIINDYSGGNYEKALGKIRELGFSPEDYYIEYINHGFQGAGGS
ncbi:MAG: hypothetical protein Q4A79_03240 [Candidatus Saccharibacteria bacterium]|nr:hypothetical protein [Candidatus Saccharibacteria bacterium]